MKRLALFVLLLTCCFKAIGDPIKFEKIVFHTTGCYGYCSVYNMELDSGKRLKLVTAAAYRYKGHLKFVKNKKRIGSFNGVVDDSLFSKIQQELENVNLDRLTFDGTLCCDAPVITIIIYCNGKRYYFKSMTPPEEAKKLIDLLYKVCSATHLHRTKTHLEIEAAKQ